MKELDIMKKEVEEVKCESKSFAYELLEDCKKRSKRDFVIIIILICVIILSNVLWINYIKDLEITDTYEEITQEQQNTTNSYMRGEIN